MNAILFLLIFTLAAAILFYIQYVHTKKKIKVLDNILSYKKDKHGYYSNRKIIYKEEKILYRSFFILSIAMMVYLMILLYI